MELFSSFVDSSSEVGKEGDVGAVETTETFALCVRQDAQIGEWCGADAGLRAQRTWAGSHNKYVCTHRALKHVYLHHRPPELGRNPTDAREAGNRGECGRSSQETILRKSPDGSAQIRLGSRRYRSARDLAPLASLVLLLH